MSQSKPVLDEKKLYQEFLDILWTINAIGEPKSTFKEVLFHLQCKDDEGNFYTIKSLAVKYKEYVDYTNSHIHKDPKFRKKNEKLLPLKEYLSEDMFKQEFKLPITARDEYLYGISRFKKDV